MLLKYLSFQFADIALNCNAFIEVDDLLPVIDNYEQVHVKHHRYETV